MILAATGHRPDKLNGYSAEAFDVLTQFATRQLERYSPTVVISGMALGWDISIAQAALDLKIPLIAAIPFPNQPAKWQPEQIAKWKQVRDHAAQVVCVSKEYHPLAFSIRNTWMVRNCNLLLALFNGSGGGTSNAVRYANKMSNGPKIVNCWKQWLASGLASQGTDGTGTE